MEPLASEDDLALTDLQLRAIAAFHASRTHAERLEVVTARTRERRLDAARRLEVLHRQHDALVSRTHEQLALSGRPARPATPRRALLAHRNEWWRRRVEDVLVLQGVEVVAVTDNGAEAVGISVAEQPDLVLVEEGVTMVPGDEVVRDVRRFSPRTRIAAHVVHGDRMGTYLDAGAVAAWTRQARPAVVAAGLLQLLERRHLPR